jgi:hypothetical protein
VTRAIAALLFVWLATANSGGYRYGVSDQAFYAAAVVKAAHPSFFSRDTPLLETQAHLMWADEIVASGAQTLDVGLPTLSFALYVVSVAGLAAAAMAFGRAAGFSSWATALFLLLLTFRHRIAKTGANSLEGYMHPRMLAFAFGVAALAAALRRRFWWAIAAGVAAACWHPTTAFWFAIVAAVCALHDPRWRRPIAFGTGAAVAVAAWGILWGPFSTRLEIMDDAWLRVLDGKDYLFPTAWPAYAWMTNLAYPIVIAIVYRRRVQRGLVVAGEAAFVTGLMALFAVFLLTVPLTAARVALAVQSQATRAFWVLDFAAVAYLAWWLAEDLARTTRVRTAIVGIVLAASIGRGAYLLSGPSRDLVTLDLPQTRWMDAMRWLRDQPAHWHVLADPGHAWKYGVSARLAAEKDTVLELGKDSALAMYDRSIAMRVAERAAALGAYVDLTAADLRALDARYELDAVIMEAALPPAPLPELYRNSDFVIYDLR